MATNPQYMKLLAVVFEGCGTAVMYKVYIEATVM
jgi:hypothetical protein